MFELLAPKIDGFQYKAIATKSSIVDIAGVPDPAMITILGKVILILRKQLSSRSNNIAIYGRSYLQDNFETIFY